MQVLNDLLNYNMKIYQDTELFNFSIDSVLLARYAIKNIISDDPILEIGTGNAVIPLIISNDLSNKIIGIELLKDSFDLGIKNVVLNNKDDQITLINCDINNYTPSDKLKYIITNPPFFKINSNRISNDYRKAAARHELYLNVDNIFAFVESYLKSDGIFFMVHRTSRFKEIFNLINKYNLSIKSVSFVYTKNNTESYMFLAQIVKENVPSIIIESPIIINNDDGTYRNEIIDRYFGGNDGKR